MPIEKLVAARLCRRFLSTFPDFRNMDRLEAVVESLAEVAATVYQAERALEKWRSQQNELPTYGDLQAGCDREPIEPAAAPSGRCQLCSGTGYMVAWFRWNDKTDHTPIRTWRISEREYREAVRQIDWITERVYDAVVPCDCRKVPR